MKGRRINGMNPEAETWSMSMAPEADPVFYIQKKGQQGV